MPTKAPVLSPNVLDSPPVGGGLLVVEAVGGVVPVVEVLGPEVLDSLEVVGVGAVAEPVRGALSVAELLVGSALRAVELVGDSLTVVDSVGDSLTAVGPSVLGLPVGGVDVVALVEPPMLGPEVSDSPLELLGNGLAVIGTAMLMVAKPVANYMGEKKVSINGQTR